MIKFQIQNENALLLSPLSIPLVAKKQVQPQNGVHHTDSTLRLRLIQFRFEMGYFLVLISLHLIPHRIS